MRGVLMHKMHYVNASRAWEQKWFDSKNIDVLSQSDVSWFEGKYESEIIGSVEFTTYFVMLCVCVLFMYIYFLFYFTFASAI